MREDEIRSIVSEVLAEQRKIHNEEADTTALQTVTMILKSFGIEEEERLEIRADFQHLRRWRKATQQAGSYTIKAMITVIVSGFVGMVWLGFKTMLGK